MIRVLLVDDQALIRAGFRALLEAEDDIDVVAEAADGRRAVELAVRHRPEVALMDVQMPVLDGIEATRQITADPGLAGVHIVMLTNYGLDQYVFEALRAGASGFLVKDTEPADLLHGVRVAARGDALLSPVITQRLIGEFVARRPAAPTRLAVLTKREREVTTLVARGLSNDEIAAHMVISPATAKTHVSRAMTKLGTVTARNWSSSPTNPVWWRHPDRARRIPEVPARADRKPPDQQDPGLCLTRGTRPGHVVR